MKRLLLAFAISGTAALAGCSMSSDEASSGEANAGRPSAEGDSAGPPSASGGPEGPGGGATGDGATPGEPVQSGQLTAGVWDDNLNFDFYMQYVAETSSLAGLPSFSLGEREAARDRALAPRGPLNELDVAVLFDTTGSMGDELSYLQSEVSAIAQRIKIKFPSTTPRFGLVVYRDHGDEYVTRSFDFTADLSVFQANLSAQSADGGGDYPEAVPEGLEEAVALPWRGGPVARMMFWIADAPHRSGTEQAVKAQLSAAVQKDIHIYPVAASGTDERAESTFRTAAQVTGGRYLFLTDDSGIGDAHKEPRIPCYHVTRFDSAMVRMIESELTGTHVLPTAEEIVRSVGAPKDGKCELSDQSQVTIY
jgi:hypothetical protein